MTAAHWRINATFQPLAVQSPDDAPTTSQPAQLCVQSVRRGIMTSPTFVAPIGLHPAINTRAHVTTVRRIARPTHARRQNAIIRACAAPSSNVTFTPIGNNTFVLEGAGTRLLIDPFLEEDLVFGIPQFFRLIKDPKLAGIARAGKFDAVVLTQHLPDHAHPPTLKRIDKDVPVIAPPSARALLTELGFRNVRIVAFDETVEVGNGVKVTAGRGSVVGPPGSTPMNALMFDFYGAKIYHEPHGVHDMRFLDQFEGVEAAIAPCVTATIPALNYALVNGADEAVQLAKSLRPKRVVAFDNSGGEYSGWLTKVLSGKDETDRLKELFDIDTELKNIDLVVPKVQLEPVVIADSVKQPVGSAS